MGIFYAILSVVGLSFQAVIDRYNFKRNRIGSRQLMFLVFAVMLACMVLYIVLVKASSPNPTPLSLLLLAVIGVISFAANYFDYRSLKADDISLREPLNDFEPIVAGLVGYLLFPAERHPGFLLALLLSVAIVYWGSHRRKLRKLERQGMVYMLIAVFLFALLPSIYKLALMYASPAYITLFRVVCILVLSSLFLPNKKLGALTSNQLGLGILSGVASSVAAVATLFAINSLGVVLTMLLMMLGPALRYFAGFFLLKEKVRIGEVVASGLLSAVILAGIVGWI
jgi:drug/metabolite transporter (DMT)-like permease